MKAKARQPTQGPGSPSKVLNLEIPHEPWSSNAQAAVNEAQFLEDWENLLQELSFLDLADPSNWSEPIEDPEEHFRALFRV